LRVCGCHTGTAHALPPSPPTVAHPLLHPPAATPRAATTTFAFPTIPTAEYARVHPHLVLPFLPAPAHRWFTGSPRVWFVPPVSSLLLRYLFVVLTRTFVITLATRLLLIFSSSPYRDITTNNSALSFVDFMLIYTLVRRISSLARMRAHRACHPYRRCWYILLSRIARATWRSRLLAAAISFVLTELVTSLLTAISTNHSFGLITSP